MKTLEKQADEFATFIFGKKCQELEMEQLLFVYAHQRYYNKKYRLNIAKAARKAMRQAKLDRVGYQIILEWYRQRIPERCVLPAIEECGKFCKTIYSLNYFKKAVNRYYEDSKGEGFTEDFTEGGQDIWMFGAYCKWQEGHWKGWKFDLFQGPNEYIGIDR